MKSVELNFVYLREGYSKTSNQINNAIPHTWIDMEYRGVQIHLVPYLNKKRVSFVALDSLKTATFSRKDKSENTFIKLCPLLAYALGNDKVRNFFAFRTTLSRVSQKILNLRNIILRYHFFGWFADVKVFKVIKYLNVILVQSPCPHAAACVVQDCTIFASVRGKTLLL